MSGYLLLSDAKWRKIGLPMLLPRLNQKWRCTLGRHDGKTARIQLSIEKWNDGCRSAGNQILDLIQSLIERYVGHKLKEAPKLANHRKEEIVSEINERLLKALKKGIKIKDIAHLNAIVNQHINWHFGDMKRQNKRAIAQKKKIAVQSNSISVSDLKANTAGPRTRAEMLEFRRQIKMMPPEYLEILQLHYSEKMALKEIAKKMKLSEPAVKRLKRRAEIAVNAVRNK